MPTFVQLTQNRTGRGRVSEYGSFKTTMKAQVTGRQNIDDIPHYNIRFLTPEGWDRKLGLEKVWPQGWFMTWGTSMEHGGRRKTRKKRGGDGDLKEKLETIEVNKNMIIEEFKKKKKEKSIKITEPQFIKFMNSVSDDDFNKIKKKLINEIIKQSSISNISRNKQGGAQLQDLISVCFVLAVFIHFMLVGVKYTISRGLHASLENPGMEFQNDPQFDDPPVLQISAANFIMCIQAHRFPDQRRGGKRRKKTRKKKMKSLSTSDYNKILKFYKQSIPKNRKTLKRKAEKIITKKFCSCIKKVRTKFKKEGIAIGICTKSVIKGKGLKRGKFRCKKSRKMRLYKGGKRGLKKRTRRK